LARPLAQPSSESQPRTTELCPRAFVSERNMIASPKKRRGTRERARRIVSPSTSSKYTIPRGSTKKSFQAEAATSAVLVDLNFRRGPGRSNGRERHFPGTKL